MISATSLAKAIIDKAESYPGIRAGITDLSAVLQAPSYRVAPDGEWGKSHTSLSAASDGGITRWPPAARSVLVLGLHHPVKRRELDWGKRGNTDGNRRLMELSGTMKHWLQTAHGLQACPLPYHLEWGGLFLKDAAVLAGLGVIGRNNLLLHREWGPRIRLRSVLIEGDIESGSPDDSFSPCGACDARCFKACPQHAFTSGKYKRPDCMKQLDHDIANKEPGGEIDADGDPVMVIKYCRECELACPAGEL